MRFTNIVALLALAATAAAQVSTVGKHTPLASSRRASSPLAELRRARHHRLHFDLKHQDAEARFESWSYAAPTDVPFFTLPPMDNELLRIEDRLETLRATRSVARAGVRTEAGGEGFQYTPYKFGEPVNLGEADFFEMASMTVDAAGNRIWRWGIKSEGALSLNLVFDKFRLREGAEFYVHNNKETLGAFTARLNNKPHLGFATTPIRGSYLVLEYFEPADLPAAGDVDEQSLLVVSHAVHGFQPLFAESSGKCNINVACRSWGPEIRSVGMLLTATGSRYCSGALINNARQDGKQYFLTANHCMSGSPTKHIIMFNHEFSDCEGRTTAPTKDTVQGLKLVATFANSDFALLEIDGEKIPESYNTFLAGFSAKNTAPNTAVGIHHPSGSSKKISFYEGLGKPTCWTECPSNLHWQIPAWSEGTTEPGSSGSPLFDGKSHLIVGQLHGGSASCSNTKGYDSYGAIWASWSTSTRTDQRLKDFLDPDSTGAVEVAGIEMKVARANTSRDL